MKKFGYMILIVSLVFILSSCMPGSGEYGAKKLAGFFTGIWHGWIAPISIIMGLFDPNIKVYEINKERMLRIADYSRERFAALRAETGIEYEGRQQGTLQVFRTEHQLEVVENDMKVLAECGIPFEKLTPEEKKALKAALGGTTKSNAIDTLTNTARNHRAKLENNLFDLKQMGCSQDILDELMQPLEFKQCKTRTQARLKKEAEAKALETPDTAAEMAPANETEGSEASTEA